MGQRQKLITVEIVLEGNKKDLAIRVGHNAEFMPRRIRKGVSELLRKLGNDIAIDVFPVDGKDVVIPCP